MDKCPICQAPLDEGVERTGRVEYDCQKCGRIWFARDANGEEFQSVSRRVTLTKMPEKGDLMSDVIKAAE
jgi:hypothetical protein